MVTTCRRQASTRRLLSAIAGCAALAFFGAVTGCGDRSLTTPSDAIDPVASASSRVDEWRTPEHLGNVINTRFADAHPAVSANELSLFFNAGAGRGGVGGRDLWVAGRASPHEPWANPVNLGSVVNSQGHDDNPSLSPDGRSLYFSSNRGGHGGFDIFVSHREDPDDDLGWGPPVNLGPSLNSEHDELDAIAFAGPGGEGLYIASNRSGSADLYIVHNRADGTYSAAIPVAELNSEADDLNPTMSRDGRTIYFASNRTGSLGMFDLWVSTRSSPAHAWSPPQNLGPAINGKTTNDVGPDLSANGRTLYFASTFRAGNISIMYDLWQTTQR